MAGTKTNGKAIQQQITLCTCQLVNITSKWKILMPEGYLASMVKPTVSEEEAGVSHRIHSVKQGMQRN